MSDLMLLGVLRMPMPQDPQEIGVMEWIQFCSRARQAADRIEADAAEIAKLQARIDALVEALSSIDIYLSDTLSGPTELNRLSYEEWLLEGITEARERARTALAALKGTEE